ncbi:hypothetical protein HX37_25455 [Salmonella enterica]|uniref:Uncharacterized protein n=1 Tax=Salmonella enterica TaxID=28901 RepID=A0A5U2FAQ0_SALER|nr:hypothetical protein [Salmonella enterica]HAK1938896.1 hypothetical protein [Salmonella enterica]
MENKHEFIRQARDSLHGLVSFSEFVFHSENVCDDVWYQDIWFELEILNALALAEWEEDGKPGDWDLKWKQKYQKEASEVMEYLIVKIESKY